MRSANAENRRNRVFASTGQITAQACDGGSWLVQRTWYSALKTDRLDGMYLPAAREHVTDVSVLTADEFLNALSPRAGGWGDSPDDWIFRGQRNADWKLLPTAMRGTRESHPFRESGIERASTMPGHEDIQHEIPDWVIRCGRLERLLEHFARELNREGLAIPRANPAVKQLITTSYSSFPDREVFPLMALAQHHCLPTLFLDWTKRAWIAIC